MPCSGLILGQIFSNWNSCCEYVWVHNENINKLHDNEFELSFGALKMSPMNRHKLLMNKLKLGTFFAENYHKMWMWWYNNWWHYQIYSKNSPRKIKTIIFGPGRIKPEQLKSADLRFGLFDFRFGRFTWWVVVQVNPSTVLRF